MRTSLHRVVLCAGLAALSACRAAPPPAPPADSRTAIDLLITGGIVITMNAERPVLSPGAVAIADGRIRAVDTPERLASEFRAADTIDATGHVVMPGLINTHTHAPMVMFRGLADDLALMEWLNTYIFPAEARTVSPEFVRAGTALAALEMIRSGTTTFVDMYYFEEEVAAVAQQAGIRGVLGQTIIQFPVPDAATPEAALARTEAFISRFKGDRLITPAVAPHSMYALDADTLKATRALATRHAVPLLIHLAETHDEVVTARERYTTTPTRWLDSLGFWGPQTLAAHGVWVPPADIALLAERGVGVSHNPESNMKLASGTAPVPAYLKAGVALGLGTDGAASNNDLDMFDAMRLASFLHKHATGDPTALPARQALELATMGGARALGLQRELGSLEPGKRADVIVVGMDQAKQTPMYDPVSHLVYTTDGDDVRDTVIEGRVVMRNRLVLTLNEAEVLVQARQMAGRVREAVAKAGARVADTAGGRASAGEAVTPRR
jgi:5-methylthioadenosine/S-adenosylhomocysteine deaminase